MQSAISFMIKKIVLQPMAIIKCYTCMYIFYMCLLPLQSEARALCPCLQTKEVRSSNLAMKVCLHDDDMPAIRVYNSHFSICARSYL